MYGNGAAIGLEITAVVRSPILQVPLVGRAACAVAVAGAATPGTVARRFATSAPQRTAPATLACGWPFEFATKLSLLAVIHFASHSRVLCSELPRGWKEML